MLHRGQGQLEPPGQHRIDHHAVAFELEIEELAQAADREDALPGEGLQLGRGAPHGERRERLGGGDGPAGEGGVEGVHDDVQVGQLGHGRAIVPA